MDRKLLKTVQTITTFRNPLADPVGTRLDPLWSADPSLKTAAIETIGLYQQRQTLGIREQLLLPKCYDWK